MTPALLLLAGLPAAACAAVSAMFPRARLSTAILGGLLAAEGAMVTIGLLLGHAGLLFPRVFASSLAGIALLFLALAWHRGRGSVRTGRVLFGVRWVRRLSRTGRGRMLLVVVAALCASFAIQAVPEILRGTAHWDGLAYHLPRALFWSRQGSFEPWPTPTWQQVGLPVASHLVLSAPPLLGADFRGAALPSLWLTLGCGVAVAAAARDLGWTRSRALTAALLFLAFPAVGQRTGELNTDMAAAFPILAGYVLWRRAGDSAAGPALFLASAGLATACRAFFAPIAALVGAVALWQGSWRSLSVSPGRAVRATAGALVLALGLCVGSYLPVYRLSGDLTGGDMGRLHSSWDRGVPGVTSSVLFGALQWTLEPLGYLPPLLRNGVMERSGLTRLGGWLTSGTVPKELWPEGFTARWYPSPYPDTSRTGPLGVLALPLLLLALPRRHAFPSAMLLLGGFLVLTAPLTPQPYNARFAVVLLAGVALLWCAPPAFSRGRGRLVPIAALGLLTVTSLSVTVYLEARSLAKAREGEVGLDDHPGASLRRRLAAEMAGRPLLVVTEGDRRDALVSGMDIAYPLRYVSLPENGDWTEAFRVAARDSTRLFLRHDGAASMVPGPRFRIRGRPPAAPVEVDVLRRSLSAAGWTLVSTAPRWEVWGIPGAPVTSPVSSKR